MAQQFQADRKSQLISALERSRAELGWGVSSVRQDLNISSHLRDSFLRQKTIWLSGAAITGWILSRLPARKKTVIKNSSGKSFGKNELKEVERTGIWLALLSILGSILKPAVTKFVSAKLTQYVEQHQHESPMPRKRSGINHSTASSPIP